MNARLRRLRRIYRAHHRRAWGDPIWRRGIPDGCGGSSVTVVTPMDYLVEIKRQGSGLACRSRFGQVAHIRKVSRRWWVVRYAVHRALAWNPR